MEQVSIFGVDPFAVIIMAVIGSGGVGWLVGPFWGNEVFGIMHRRLGGQIAEVGFFLLLCSLFFLFRCVFGLDWIGLGWFWFWFGLVLVLD